MKRGRVALTIARYVAVTLGYWTVAFCFPIFVAMLAVGHCPEVRCQIAGRHAMWWGIAVSTLPYLWFLWRCHRAWSLRDAE